MKKAMTWLTNHNIEYTFFDYKKETISTDWLTQILAEHGLAIVMNKRGTTYRKLDDETKTLLSLSKQYYKKTNTGTSRADRKDTLNAMIRQFAD